MQLIVGNDGGGTIFDGLEVAGSADAALLDRVMLTAQRVDFAALASAYGWEYRRVSNRGELDAALSPGDEQVLIEVPLER
jgi:2-succinyl-5-enolpyruvyl-6-hydroxy-3-cyclohexene-1-carboxylate synthase